MGAISVLIGVLIIVVVGAICFWVIDRFAPALIRYSRLAAKRLQLAQARHPIPHAGPADTDNTFMPPSDELFLTGPIGAGAGDGYLATSARIFLWAVIHSRVLPGEITANARHAAC